MSTELARQFDLAPTEQTEVTIVYAFEPSLQVERALNKSKTDGRMAHMAQAALSDAIVERGAQVQTDLRRAGIRIVRRSRMYPAIFALATREQIDGLAADPRILRVGLTRHAGQATLFATDGPVTGPTNTMSVPRLTTFKTQAFSAANQGVGIIESGECALYDQHEAFHYNEIKYQATPRSCVGDGDCGRPCGFQADDYTEAACIACIDSRCVVRHASGVAGAISATTDFGYGAYRARLYYANQSTNPDGSASGCDDDKIDDAYTWFATYGVTTVVESWGCLSAPGEQDANGPLQDFYSRLYDITVVRAAGNDPENNACPHIHNAICVGSSSSVKSYLNPIDGPHHDREEPDVVTLADNVLVPTWYPPSPTGGTSLAQEGFQFTPGVHTQYPL